MALSLLTDYALRTLLFLAARPGRATVGQLAAFYQISRHHVAKVVHLLARLGYLRSVRGVGGGLELADAARRVSVGQLIEEIEGRRHLLECVGEEGVCVIQPACKLRRVLAEAERRQREYLRSVLLLDLVRPAAGLGQFPLIEINTSRGRARSVAPAVAAPSRPSRKGPPDASKPRRPRRSGAKTAAPTVRSR